VLLDDLLVAEDVDAGETINPVPTSSGSNGRLPSASMNGDDDMHTDSALSSGHQR
jgi:hypothetical protein